MAFVDDIASSASPPSAAPTTRKLSSYQNFVTERRTLLYSNVKAYTNKRTATRRFPDTKLRKVLKGATYIQAHPTRYASGEFNVEHMAFFVIHRPGSYPKACTLLNTLRTFTDDTDGRKASTHFVIGLNGELIQMVDLADRSFHTGTSSSTVFNSNSVGVELEGAVRERFTLAQYTTLAKVIRMLHDLSGFLGDLNSATYIQDSRGKILGHQEISSQKRDPGYNFNYALLASMVKSATTTSRNAIFRSPVDPLLGIETSLQGIITESQDPGSVGSAGLLAASMQDAFGMQRAMLMSLADRTGMASAAATAAQKQAAFISRKVAEMAQQIELLGLTWSEVPKPGEDYQTYVDYGGALGTYVTTDTDTEDTGG